MALFMRYPWPGNVRELENTIERLVVLSEDGVIKVDDIPSYIREGITLRRHNPDDSLIAETERLEKERIIEALKRCSFNQSRAARLLGITQRQIGYKIQKYGIKKEGQ